jgi:hypothetical protein
VTSRPEWLARIAEERVRQDSLFGSEWDRSNGPNDWIALLSHYAGESVKKKSRPPSRADFEASLIKTAAVALAALETLDAMVEKRKLIDGE